MKRLLLAALFASSVTFVLPTASACHLTDPLNPGCWIHTTWEAQRKCGFNSSTDVTREPGWQTGVIYGGPFATPEGGTLSCSIHVNNDVHSGPAVAGASGTTGIVSVVAPTTLNYPATAADDISMCTQYDTVSGTWYWTSGNTAAAQIGSWSQDPNASCGVATSIEPNDPECSIWKAIDRRLGTNIAEIWQDCEPYEEFPLPI